jgi:uncharacterized membrane protein YccC
MIDYIREYKKYSSSYYFSEGVRTTTAVMVPLLIAAYFNALPTGVALALGAMCVGVTDNTGPIHHRINGMVATILLVFLTSLLTGFILHYTWLLAVFICMMGFACSFIGVYGVRAGNIGGAGLLIMVLSIDEKYDPGQLIRKALLIGAGGLFYLTIALLLYRLRPYKLIQQALGDELLATANYLRTRAAFYAPEVDYNATYQQLLEQQVQVHNKQQLVREMLFKTREIVQESTHISRIMMMIFLDSVDLFERIMTSQQDYRQLHSAADELNVLPTYGRFINRLAAEAENIGLALQEGKSSLPDAALQDDLIQLEFEFDRQRAAQMNNLNIETFISLRQILNSLKDLFSRIEILHRYTSFDQKIGAAKQLQIQYDKFVAPSEFNLKLLSNNISLSSNIFRHAVRVGIALLAGFFLSRLLPFGHGYWILLTIVVILKPAYSLTKTRNIERLMGTFTGAVIGGVALWVFKDARILTLLMIVGMVVAYSMIRLKYLVSVIAMTAYILIAFHFLKPGNFSAIFQDRLIDTVAGSAIAFIATLAIAPKWEHQQIQELITMAIKANAKYFQFVTKPFLGENLTNHDYKLHRKEAFVQLANLSDAFQRMLNEPKRYQKNIQFIHQIVVADHMLSAHIATLSSYHPLALHFPAQKFRPIIDAAMQHLSAAANGSPRPEGADQFSAIEENFIIREELKQLLQKRSGELNNGSFETATRKELSALKSLVDQFEYIYKISIELEKLRMKTTGD